MSVIVDQNMGKLVLPREWDRALFVPGRTTPVPNRYSAVVSVAVHDGRTGRKTHAEYVRGLICRDGLAQRWEQDERLQRQFAGVDAVIAEMKRRTLVSAWYGHNERTQNGARMVAKQFWGTSPTLSNATVNAPTRIALANAGITPTYTDQSLGSITANVTTNEATTNGMARTGALTPSGATDATSFDGQYSLVVANVFTDATAASTLYNAALVDNTVGAFNQFAEGASNFTSVTLQVADTLTVSWSLRF